MSFAVVVPTEILEQVASWDLAVGVEDEMLDRLKSDLEYGHEQTCFRLAAPSPTFVYQLALPDPAVAGLTHLFTFHLTYGEQEDTLYVRYIQHEQGEDYSSDQGEDHGPAD
jgi:hypothetical protein